MKVKELIRQLEGYDPEARVYTSSYMGEGTDEVLACIAYVHNGDVIIENENQFDVENEIEGIVLTGSIGSATEPFNFEDEINRYFKNKYELKVISKESGSIGAAQIAMDLQR